jgi:predicted transcriptional regulator
MKEIAGIRLYDVKEVSGLLGVSVASVRTYMKREKNSLRSQMIGHKLYITEGSIKEFLNGQYEKKASEEQTE